MNPITEMRINRIQDAADLAAFRSLGTRQVYAQSGPGLSANGFLTPYFIGGEWRITIGFVDGTVIAGSGAKLPDMGPNKSLYIRCTVTREVVNSPPDEYLTGRYQITSAQLLVVGAGDVPEDGGTFADIVTHQLVFTCDERGNPPAGQSMPHQKIDRTNLSL